MAVFKEELNWSSYQDRQLKVLQSLDQSFNDSLKISLQVNKSLEAITMSINAIASKVVGDFSRQVDQSSRATSNFSKSVSQSERLIIGAADGLSQSYKDHKVILDQHGSVLSDITKQEQEAAEERAKAKEEEKQERLEREQAQEKLLGQFTSIIQTLGRSADDYSALTNSLMRYSEEGREGATDYRSTLIHDIVTDLNAETMGAFNAKESMSQMVALANQAGIGNLDVLEEISRPILLASKSMDVNISGLSTLLGKWSTRYNFSSIAMEDMLDNIRNNTAGNMATAESILQNTAKLDNAMAYYAGGDEDKLLQMTEAVAQGTAWLESMNVDTARYTQYINDIAYGDAAQNTQLIQLLEKSGLTAMQAQDMFANGEIDEIFKALYQGEVSIVQGFKDQGIDLLGPTAKALGMNIEEMMDSYNAATGENAVSLEEFLANQSSDKSMAEAVEEQYVSMEDKIQNNLSGITSILSTIQETLGFGLSDLAVGILAAQGATAGIKTLTGGLSAVKESGGILKAIGKALGFGAAGGGSGGAAVAASGAISVGSIVTVAGGLAAIVGIALALKDTIGAIKDINEKIYENTGKSLDKEVKSAEAGDHAVLTKTIDANTGLTEWGTQIVSGEEYQANKEMYDQLQKEFDQSKIQDVQDISGWNKAWNWMVGGYNPDGIATKPMSSRQAYEKNQHEVNQLLELTNQILADPEWKETYEAYSTAFAESLTDNKSRIELMTDILEKDLAHELLENNRVLLNDEFVDAHQVTQFAAQGYETGSNYITSNQLAYLHEGEAVIPKRYNPAANMTELQMLREQSKIDRDSIDRQHAESQAYMQTLSDTLSEIKEFLKEWQQDNITRETTYEFRNRFKFAQDNLVGFGG